MQYTANNILSLVVKDLDIVFCHIADNSNECIPFKSLNCTNAELIKVSGCLILNKAFSFVELPKQ
jgi:hypothetical protein